MSNEGPYFLAEPWGLLLDEGVLASATGDHATVGVCGRGSPRIVTQIGHELKWSGGIGSPPVAGFPFRWEGRIYQSWHTPCTHLSGASEQALHYLWTIPSSNVQGGLLQRDVVFRSSRGDETEDGPAFNLDVFINWLVNSFQELGHKALEDLDSTAGGLVRRTWTHANKVWLEPDSDEPRIELIIKMAQDAPLLKVLESISQNPRRILLRVRQNTPLSRVQELDAACIRHYARLPGRTSMQKAGTRQVLLSVQRTASHDTLENKVTCWTLTCLRKRADQWKRMQTEKARNSQRSKAVANLAKHSFMFVSKEALAEVSFRALSHPVPANYPLMMDSRYKRVYKAYRELLKYQKITDEAWTWRRALWAEGVSQLVSCAIRLIWTEMYQSSPYYRTEPDRGRWMVAPCGAGPFHTPRGPMFVVDFHDFESIEPSALNGFLSERSLMGTIGALGCDLALWWPEKEAIVAIWSVLWTGSDAMWGNQLSRAARAVSRFRAANSNLFNAASHISGIAIGTTVRGTDVELDEGQCENIRVTGLRMPMRVDAQDPMAFASIIKNLRAGIEMAFGDMS